MEESSLFIYKKKRFALFSDSFSLIITTLLLYFMWKCTQIALFIGLL